MLAKDNVWSHPVMENLRRDDGLTASAVINERNGPFPLWERLASPEGPCEMLMEDATYIALGDYGHPLCGRFLEWAMSTADRAIADPRFEIGAENRSKGWKNSPSFPGNRGRVMAISALAKAMKSGAEIEQDALREAADQIARSALLEKGRDWADKLVQSQFMYAVRLLMISGDWQLAQNLIAVKRKFEAVPRQYQVIKGLLESCRGNQSPELNSPAWRNFQDYLENVRPPGANALIRGETIGGTCFFRAQIGLIHQRVTSRGQPIVWTEVFAVIGHGP